MQRLKALVTGTLPTFVDAGSNFGSAEISEDNLLSQLHAHARVLHFSGDDTWTNLFPSHFAVANPYPSFNVQDLHTVDNGCISHLFPALAELSSSSNNTNSTVSWDFLVAHFLGVDHVGHSFGPDTPPMADKLHQVNGWLEHVFSSIDDDTLVVVIGDHGMDPKGDHGGDSENEVSAALFLYAKNLIPAPTPPSLATLLASVEALESRLTPQLSPIATTMLPRRVRTVPQIDIVPTLSVLLGVPIPFGNLGAALPELFYVPSSGLRAHANLVEVAHANAVQMHTYLRAYGAQRRGDSSAGRGGGGGGGDGGRGDGGLGIGSSADSAALARMYADAETLYARWAARADGRGRGGVGADTDSEDDAEDDVAAAREVYLAHLAFSRAALAAAQRVWARFDVPLIVCGVLAGVAALVLVAAAAAAWWISPPCVAAGVAGFAVGGITGAGVAATGGGGVRALLDALPSDEGASVATWTHEVVFAAVLSAVAGFVLATVASAWSAKRTSVTRSPADCLALPEAIAATLLLILSSGVPASDSFTIHEEAVTAHLLQAFGAYILVIGANAQSQGTRAGLAARALAFMVLTRVSRASTVCREEKAQTCVPTFNSAPASSVASPLAVAALLAAAPTVLAAARGALGGGGGGGAGVTASAHAHARLARTAVPAGALGAWVYWAIDTLNGHRPFAGARAVKVWLARAVLLGGAGAGLGMWIRGALARGGRRGSALDAGQSYFVFVLWAYAALLMFQKPMGGVMLGVEMLQIILLVQIFASVRDDWAEAEPAVAGAAAKTLAAKSRPVEPDAEKPRLFKRHDTTAATARAATAPDLAASGGVAAGAGPKKTRLSALFLFAVVLHIVGQRAYFATGHQYTLASIQWEAAFVGLFDTSFVLGPVLMALNTFAGPLLAAAAVPLLGLWRGKHSRSIGGGSVVGGRAAVLRDTGAAVVLAVAAAATWGFGATAMVGHFRRHLMVWSVFAPKFLGVNVGMVIVELFLVLGVAGGAVASVL